MSSHQPPDLQCAQCGEPLAKDSPGGLCPRCLIGSALDDSGTSLDLPGEDPGTLPLAEQPGPPDPLEGSRIGDYKLLQRIGEGGFGAVYMAEQVEHVHRKVALKIIKAGMDTRQVIARFEAERQALAMMEHPNIARVLDVGETPEGRPYFVMELVKGIPITAYCRDKRLSIAERLGLFGQVCSAVQHAHLKGIIHRDLKPSNILVTTRDGKALPKVIDFGIAKAMDTRLTDKTLFTRFEHMIGTPAYMSPEQVALSEVDVDTRSDVYSLGVLLYELLTGTPPLDAKDLQKAAFEEMRSMIRDFEPPKPSTRLTTLNSTSDLETGFRVPHTNIARDLDWIVMKAMAKDRGRRYETASGLARDLERFAKNEPVVAGPPSAAYRLSKFARRHRVGFTAGAAVVLALLAGLALAAVGFLEARKERDLAVEARQEAEAAQLATKQEAEISEAVSEFLEFLISQADPLEREREKDMTLREAVDVAADEIDERFDGQPEVRARINAVVGRTYDGLGERVKAETHLRTAIEISTAHAGAQDPATLDYREMLVLLLLSQNRKEALTVSEALLVDQLEVLGSEHPSTLRSQVTISTLKAEFGLIKPEEAEKRLQEILAIQERVIEKPAEMAPTRAALLAVKAIGDGPEGDFAEEAREIVRKIQEDVEEESGSDIKLVEAATRLMLAKDKPPAELEPLMREFYEVTRQSFGEDNPETVQAMGALAGILSSLKRYEEALNLQERIVAVEEARDDPIPVNLAMARWDIAKIFVNTGRHEEALPLLEAAVPVLSDDPGSFPEWRVKAGLDFACVHARIGDVDKAEKLFRENFEAAGELKKWFKKHDLVSFEARYAEALHLGGHSERAREPMERACLQSAAVHGGESLVTAGHNATLGAIHKALGRHEDAAKAYKRTYDLRSEKLEEGAPLILESHAAWLLQEREIRTLTEDEQDVLANWTSKNSEKKP